MAPPPSPSPWHSVPWLCRRSGSPALTPLSCAADRAAAVAGRAAEGAVQAAGGRPGKTAAPAQHRAGKEGSAEIPAGDEVPNFLCWRCRGCHAHDFVCSSPGEAHCLLRAGDSASSLSGSKDYCQPGCALQCLHHAAGLRGLQHASRKSGQCPSWWRRGVSEVLRRPRGRRRFSGRREGVTGALPAQVSVTHCGTEVQDIPREPSQHVPRLPNPARFLVSHVLGYPMCVKYTWEHGATGSIMSLWEQSCLTFISESQGPLPFFLHQVRLHT